MNYWNQYLEEISEVYETYKVIMFYAAIIDFIIFVAVLIAFFIMVKKVANIDNKMNTIILLLSQNTVKKD